MTHFCSIATKTPIRMEPVFMILGQSAATAAAIAIDDQVSVQQVDYEKLKEQLLEDTQRLTLNDQVLVN